MTFPKFTLGPEITAEQSAFLEEHGFLHFEGVLSKDEVANVIDAVDGVEARFLAEKRTSVHGIPLFFGKKPDGTPGIQRLAFASLFSESLSRLVRDSRFDPVRRLIAWDARVGEREKDGLVVNRFTNVPGSAFPRLGWHTDGLRDLFYLRMPGAMLNVGLHLDDCPEENGGLRLIPGSHRQGFLSMCFRKPYFVWHRPDPGEHAVETKAGDLTVHDGRLWHRVQASRRTGPASVRRSMYVPYLTGPYEPKSEQSATPAYHHLGRALRALKRVPPPSGRGVMQTLTAATPWGRVHAAFSRRTGAIALIVALIALLLALATPACAAGFWNFDTGASNYARGGANIAAPVDPVAIYTNPSALAGLDGFRFFVEGNMAWDHRRFERAPDRLDPVIPYPHGMSPAASAAYGQAPTEYSAAQSQWPAWPPSPGFFASYRNPRLSRLTLGGALYGPPRSDPAFSADGAQRYSLVESHNLQIQSAIAASWEFPWRRARVGVTAMSINQVIRTRLVFNTFLGAAEDPGYDAQLKVRARDEFIPAFTLATSISPLRSLTAAAVLQLPYDVNAHGRAQGELGSALASQATVRPGNIAVHTKMPPIARGALRWDDPAGRFDAELAIVWEGWSRNDEVRFVPARNGLALVQEDFKLAVPAIGIPTHLRDTWSVRAGGETRVVPGRLALRGGVFYERAAISPRWLNAANFDLDKVGLSSGARVHFGRSWLDIAGGWQYWIPAEVTESKVRILNPLSGTHEWPIGNGRYSNHKFVAMAGFGFVLGK